MASEEVANVDYNFPSSSSEDLELTASPESGRQQLAGGDLNSPQGKIVVLSSLQETGYIGSFARLAESAIATGQYGELQQAADKLPNNPGLKSRIHQMLTAMGISDDQVYLQTLPAANSTKLPTTPKTTRQPLFSNHTDVSSQSVETLPHQPYELPKNEVIRLAQRDLSVDDISPEALEAFLDNVHIIRVNGVDITLIDWEYLKDAELSPLLKGYMKASRTRVVVSEYFEPELRSKKLLGISSNNDFDRARTKEAERIKTGKKPDPMGRRLWYARQFKEACEEAGKDVAVVDLANKPAYMLQREFYRAATYPYESGLQLYNAFTQPDSKLNFIVDTHKMRPVEDFTLHLEDARRYFVAKGIMQLVSEFPPLPVDDTVKEKNPEWAYAQEHPQIIVPYPKAHRLRIEAYLLHPNKFSRKAKNLLFKTIAPNLDFNVRLWRYAKGLEEPPLDNSGNRDTSHQSSSAWMQISSTRM